MPVLVVIVIICGGAQHTVFPRLGHGGNTVAFRNARNRSNSLRSPLMLAPGVEINLQAPGK